MEDSTEPAAGPPEAPAERPHECGLTPEQYRVLLLPIRPARVQHKDGASHVEAWDVRRYLNRVFGFTGWGTETRAEHVATYRKGANETGNFVVCYLATVRLTIRCRCGAVLTVHEGTATGSGAPQPRLEDAHDFAVKTAESQALKRAAVHLGDAFGLSLYNKGDQSAVVGFTMVPPAGWAPPVPVDTDKVMDRDTVQGGELDEVVPEGVDMDIPEGGWGPERVHGGVSPRGQMSPEDRASMDNPAVPPPVDMDKAVDTIVDMFPGASQVPTGTMSQEAVDSKIRFLSRAMSLKTLAAQYRASLPDGARMTGRQKIDVGAAFNEAYTRITGGMARPSRVEDWPTDEEVAKARILEDEAVQGAME